MTRDVFISHSSDDKLTADANRTSSFQAGGRQEILSCQNYITGRRFSSVNAGYFWVLQYWSAIYNPNGGV